MKTPNYDVMICSCADGPYLGAHKLGTPECCETCGFLTPAQYAALVPTEFQQVWSVGWKREDGSVFNVGISDVGYSHIGAAQKAVQRARDEAPVRPYVLITKWHSEWKTA